MRLAAEYLVDVMLSNEYCHDPRSTDLMENPVEDPQAPSISTADRIEFTHLASVSHFYEAGWWDQNDRSRRLFKEVDANWLFFYPLAHHIASVPLSVTVKL